jgi:hypothetical protein
MNSVTGACLQLHQLLVQDAGGSELPQLIRLLPAVALHSCKMDGAIVTARCAHHVTAE